MRATGTRRVYDKTRAICVKGIANCVGDTLGQGVQVLAILVESAIPFRCTSTRPDVHARSQTEIWRTPRGVRLPKRLGSGAKQERCRPIRDLALDTVTFRRDLRSN
jgi:hypothetical protein